MPSQLDHAIESNSIALNAALAAEAEAKAALDAARARVGAGENIKLSTLMMAYVAAKDHREDLQARRERLASAKSLESAHAMNRPSTAENSRV